MEKESQEIKSKCGECGRYAAMIMSKSNSKFFCSDVCYEKDFKETKYKTCPACVTRYKVSGEARWYKCPRCNVAC